MLVVALNGSPNRNGNTAFLLNEVKKHIEKLGGEFEIINVQSAVLDCKHPFCMECKSPCDQNCLKGTKLEEAYNKITKADAVIVGSPVYFGTVSAQLKCFFDKSRYIRTQKKWIGKIGAVVTVGASKYGGQELTASTIQNMLMVHGFNIINDGYEEFDSGHFGVNAQKPADEDIYAIKRAEVLAYRIKQEIDKKA